MTFNGKTSAAAADTNAVRRLMPCGFCQNPTPITVLGQHGGRCTRCFEAYCAEAFAPRPHVYDTVQQAEMRKHLKRSRPVGQAMARSDAEIDSAARDAAKAETARRVAEYARKFGVSLEQSEAIHARDHQSRDGSATRVREHGVDPARGTRARSEDRA